MPNSKKQLTIVILTMIYVDYLVKFAICLGQPVVRCLIDLGVGKRLNSSFQAECCGLYVLLLLEKVR